MFPFGAAAFVGMVLVADWAGTNDWPTRIVLARQAVAVAVAATTDYKVLAQTSSGMVLLRASRIRQVATGMIELSAAGSQLVQVGGTIHRRRLGS